MKEISKDALSRERIKEFGQACEQDFQLGPDDAKQTRLAETGLALSLAIGAMTNTIEPALKESWNEVQRRAHGSDGVTTTHRIDELHDMFCMFANSIVDPMVDRSAVARSNNTLDALIDKHEASLLPVPMLLHCPVCNARHVDQGDFATKPHHTHACQSCGHVWRPALVATVGVQFLPGFKDT